MNSNSIVEPRVGFRAPGWLRVASGAAIVFGLLGFIVGFATIPKDAWLWLLVCFVYFVGLTHGVMIWAAVFRVAQARWTPAVNRLSHSAIAFVPVLLLVTVILLSGVRHYLPWVTDPLPEKAAWLNVPFMVIRDLLSLFALWVTLLILVRLSLIVDSRHGTDTAIPESNHQQLNTVGTVILFVYPITGSILAYDFIMSLSPHWVSTMFAPYFWVTNAYLGLAVLTIMAALLRRPLGMENYLGEYQFRDIGNLMLGFALFSMGLFFAQYLTIWYGNLPEETPFLIIRYYKGSWPWLGWTAFMIGYAIPFVLLQSRRLKRNPKLISPVAVLIVLGIALERYVLIVPSIWPQRLMLNPVLYVGSLAFLGAFALTVTGFLARYPSLSSADLALREYDVKLEVD